MVFRLIITFCFLSVVAQSQIVINEISIQNYNHILDMDGEASNWVEIYNAGSVSQDLNNYSLSDRWNQQKFKFPSLILPPGGFKIIFLSGKNRSLTEWHTNFKLKDSETVFLFDDSNSPLDQINCHDLQLDHSKGRFPDGTSDIRYFNSPTPLSSNSSSTPYLGYTNLQSNYSSGFYNSPILVSLSSSNINAQIYFETNGNKPSQLSETFFSPLSITQNSIVRAVAVAPGFLPSQELNATYFIGENPSLQVISILTDSLNLWDNDSGIFVLGPLADSLPPYYGANFWQDTEYPTIFQLYKNKEIVFQQEIDLSIHGGSINRSQPMKSLRLTASKKYGKKRMEYRFLSSRNYIDYKQLVLRNGSSDFCKSHMRDELVAENLIHSTNNDVIANEPCLVYINGNYWGLYNMHEKRGRFTIANLYDVNEDSLDIIRDNIYAWEGDTVAFREMYDYVLSNDLTSDSGFEGFEERMNIDNFTDYYIGEIYYGNFDWPFNNIECWRERKPESKFRYLLFDLDVAFTGTVWFDHTYNLWDKIFSSYCDTNLHIQIFRKALTNTNYYQHFVNRYCDLLNTIFTPENLNQVANKRENLIAPEIFRHFNHWGNSPSIWSTELTTKIHLTCDLRPQIQLEQLKNALLPGDISAINLSIQPENAGSIHLNTITIDTSQWKGNYFNAVPIKLKQIPKEGFIFKAWKIEKNNETYFNSNDELSLLPEENIKITAIYSDENSKSNFSIFPNPVNDIFTVRLTNTLELEGKISITNLMGQKIIEEDINPNLPINDFQWNLFKYKPGVYIVWLISDSSVDQIKFVKQ